MLTLHIYISVDEVLKYRLYQSLVYTICFIVYVYDGCNDDIKRAEQSFIARETG